MEDLSWLVHVSRPSKLVSTVLIPVLLCGLRTNIFKFLRLRCREILFLLLFPQLTYLWFVFFSCLLLLMNFLCLGIAKFELLGYSCSAVINSRPRFGVFVLNPKPGLLVSSLFFVSPSFLLVDFAIILVFACPNRCSIHSPPFVLNLFWSHMLIFRFCIEKNWLLVKIKSNIIQYFPRLVKSKKKLFIWFFFFQNKCKPNGFSIFKMACFAYFYHLK